MNKTLAIFFFSLFFVLITNAQDKVIQLYNGAAPGSESWTWNEATNTNNAWKTDVVYNVSHPTLTVFAPDSLQSTGTAVVICPGGAFHALSINSEGYDVAKWLVKKGVTCFVLKYRLAHSVTTDPVKEVTDKWGSKDFDDENRADIPLAIADGKAAIAYVRSHADEYGIDKNKIGIMGFSAGGTVTAGCMFSYTPENKPDFAAPIYAFYPDSIMTEVPADAPPIFVAAATDDGLGLASHSVSIYQHWLASKHSAELHMYSSGNHGFGMRVQHMPSDAWIDRFGDWLRTQGLLKWKQTPSWAKNVSDWDFEEARKRNDDRVHADWAGVNRYRDANAATIKMQSNKQRVVFMGNSITDAWIFVDSSFFAGKNYIDRGYSGQTTPQMLVRFRQDVLNLKPAVVVILAGINDIAQNTGVIPLEETYGNIVSMAELAKAENVKVVLCSTLPAFDFPWRPGMQPANKVIELNKMIKAYAEKNHIVYVDYFSAMKDDRNGLPSNLSGDGVHPNLAGYKIMEGLVEKGIADAMKQK